MTDFKPKNRYILYGYRGSKAHNLYVSPNQPMATDDIDLMGVCVSPMDYYIGIKYFEGTDYWDEDQDIVIYDIKKFIRLLMKGNPNVLSFLWNNNHMFLVKTKEGQILLDNRELFSTAQAYYSFGGYARSQLKKMFSQSYQGYMGAKRKALVDKYGYDCKNASHLIRLLKMGKEFLSTGQLTVFRIEDRQELIDIKQGRWTANKVESYANALFEDLKIAYRRSALPDGPDYKKINKLLIDIISSYNDIRHPKSVLKEHDGN